MSVRLVEQSSSATADRPSLFGEAPEPGAEIQNDSILGGLETPRRGKKRLGVLLVTLLVLAGGMAGWQAMQERHQASMEASLAGQSTGQGDTRAGREEVAPTEASATAASATAASAAAPAGIVTPPQDSRPAAIVAEVVPPTGKPAASDETAQSAGNATPAHLPEASGQVAAAARENVQQAAGVEKAAVAPAATGSGIAAMLAASTDAQSAGNASTAGAGEKSADKKEKLPVTQAAAPAATPAASAAKAGGTAANTVKTVRHGGARQPQKDGDVELIAALLNRVSAQPEGPAEGAARKSAAGKTPQKAAAGAQKKNRKTTAPAAAAKPVADGAEAELKRCGSLGFLESELCRLRACSGRWGSDPACPEYAQASAYSP